MTQDDVVSVLAEFPGLSVAEIAALAKVGRESIRVSVRRCVGWGEVFAFRLGRGWRYVLVDSFMGGRY